MCCMSSRMRHKLPLCLNKAKDQTERKAHILICRNVIPSREQLPIIYTHAHTHRGKLPRIALWIVGVSAVGKHLSRLAGWLERSESI